MKVNLTVEEAISKIRGGEFRHLTGRIGCVYADGESYFIHSNLGACDMVECIDGFFFAEERDGCSD